MSFSDMGWCCWVNFGVSTLFCCFKFVLVAAAIVGGLICIPGFIWARRKVRKQKIFQKSGDPKFSIGLFHPYCNAGGGGERVLWCALKALSEKFPNYRYVIYTGDTNVSRTQFLEKVKSNFDITFSNQESVEFIYLTKRKWVEASTYPYVTLLGQSLGSVGLGLEALSQFVPDVFIDTMGYAFTLPIFKYLGQSKVGCYIHYPTISTDMLSLISSRTESYNNMSTVARSPTLSKLKLIYYKFFAWLYSTVGYYSSDVIMVNSSWTLGHINLLWKCPNKTHTVYPPCNIQEFQAIKRTNLASSSNIKILSIAQFRPEKNYPLQIESLAALKEILDSETWSKIQLVCIGSCRNDEDRERVDDLKRLAVELNVDENVTFKTNVSFNDLKKEMSVGLIGLHTMWNEHFGIGIVESMAAGLIMVANNSGGPMMDIIDNCYEETRTGLLATTKDEYANCIKQIINMTTDERNGIIERARCSVERFSDMQFNKDLLVTLSQVMQEEK